MSEPLESGWYLLRIVSIEDPNPGQGGMYLTLLDRQVIVAAQVPETFGHQEWFIQAVEGERNVYKIERPGILPGEGLREGLLDTNDEIPVVFGPFPQQWRIKVAVDPDVYEISPNKEFPIGVDHLVCPNADRKVVVKGYPVVPGDRPAWEIQRTAPPN